MNNYRKAMSYAYKLDSTNYKDLVHSAYLSHYDRNNGENLFERHELYVLRAIKLQRHWQHQSRQFEIRGEKFIRNHTYYETDNPDNNTPDLILEKEEAYKNLLQQIDVFETREQLLQVITYKVAGYKQVEIADLMGISEALVSYYMKRLKSLI